MRQQEYEISGDLLKEIRGKFAHIDVCPFEGERVYFESSGGALTLNSVIEASGRFAAIPDNEGRMNAASHAVTQIIQKGMDDVRLFMNADNGQVFVGETGTEILFRLVRRASLGALDGGNVVGSTLEHPSSRSAAMVWAQNTNREYLAVPHNSETGSVDVDDYMKFVSADTRLATIIQTSPVTGMSVDVASISKAIRTVAPGCFIIVDGIQHAAHGHVDIQSLDADGYAISPYKMFSRHGYGLGWASDRLSQIPFEGFVREDGTPKRIEAWELGTRDVGSYRTFSEVVAYFEWLGGQFTNSSDRREKIEVAAKAIHSQESGLTEAILKGVRGHKGLRDIEGIQIIGGVDNHRREGVVSFACKQIDSPELVARLGDCGIRVYERMNDVYSGSILSPLGLDSCVRVSVCHYNSLDEVERFLVAIDTILDEIA